MAVKWREGGGMGDGERKKKGGDGRERRRRAKEGDRQSTGEAEMVCVRQTEQGVDERAVERG